MEKATPKQNREAIEGFGWIVSRGKQESVSLSKTSRSYSVKKIWVAKKDNYTTYGNTLADLFNTVCIFESKKIAKV